MKKLAVLLLCVLLLCMGTVGAQGTSILRIESIEEALTKESNENRGSVCVIVGKWCEDPEIVPNVSTVWDIDVLQVIYGDVDEVQLVEMYDAQSEPNYDAPDIPFLFILQPAQYISSDGRAIVSNKYHRVGVYQGQFCFVDGELRGGNPWLIEEILSDDPTIDTMDELTRYFEKRIDALQREGKLPPDPVDWPGILGAAGAIVVVLGGGTAALIWKRRRAEA